MIDWLTDWVTFLMTDGYNLLNQTNIKNYYFFRNLEIWTLSLSLALSLCQPNYGFSIQRGATVVECRLNISYDQWRPNGRRREEKEDWERRLLVSITELSLLRDDRAVSQPFPGNQSPVRQEKISLEPRGGTVYAKSLAGSIRLVDRYKNNPARELESHRIESIHHSNDLIWKIFAENIETPNASRVKYYTAQRSICCQRFMTRCFE